MIHKVPSNSVILRVGNGDMKFKADRNHHIQLLKQPSLYFSNMFISLSQFSVAADVTHLEMYRHMVKRRCLLTDFIVVILHN